MAPRAANCSSNGTQNCVATGSYYAAAACAANVSNCFVPDYVVSSQPLKAISYDAINAGKASMRSSLTLAGVPGTLLDCTTNETSGCVTTSTYKSADLTNLSVDNIKKGVVIAGKTGSYPSADTPLALGTGTPDLTSFGSSTPVGTYEFFDSSGNVYAATIADGATITPTTAAQAFGSTGTMYRAFSVAGDANLTIENIKSGVRIFNVDGNVNPAPAICSANGSQSCVATGSYFAAAACATNGSNCFVPNYVVSSQPLKAISFDAIDAGKASMRSSLSLAGVSGTLADCSANEVSGCVTTSAYKSADLTNLAAGNIKRGISLGGVTGNFPSAASPIPRYTDSSATTDIGGTDISDLTMFITQLTTDGAFEYWDSMGIRRTGSGDTDITASNVKNAVAFENLAVTGTSTGAAACTGDGQIGCTTTERYKSVDTIWPQVVLNTVYKDHVTGLVWLRDQGAFDWYAAMSQCENSTAGSRSDWRLPTWNELTTAFSNGIWASRQTNLSLADALYWSSTSGNSDNYAFSINPNNGNYANYVVAFKPGTLRVICVAP